MLARGEPVQLFRSRIAEADDLATALGEAAAILQTRMRERDEAQQEVDRNRAALLAQEQAGRRDAEALSRAKDEFVATVSHELRTPLNAIYGWVALLKTGQLDPDRHGHALEVIERNTRAQAQLIDDLLDMSRMIRGTLRLEMRPVVLSEVLEAAVDSVRPTAAARQISLSLHQGPEAVASADQGRLQQVLWNLLANALKFTPAGGHVEARLLVEGNEAVIRITDDGEGIAPEFLPYVFDRFRQETGDITRTHSGLGIGLALVRYLAELHGGSVSAHSAGKGKGSVFSLRLPIVRVRRGEDIERTRGRRIAGRTIDAGRPPRAGRRRRCRCAGRGHDGARPRRGAGDGGRVGRRGNRDCRRRRDPPGADRHRHAERQWLRPAAHAARESAHRESTDRGDHWPRPGRRP